MANISNKTDPADQTKTKAQLLAELNELRRRVAQLEAVVESLKQAEERYQQSEEKYRAIFDNDIYAIATYDLETRQFFDVNEAFSRLYGYSRAELLSGMTVYDLTAEVQATAAAIQQGSSEGTRFIPLRYHRKKDGTVFPVELAGGFYTWQGHQARYAIVHDISERKRMEQALRESEAELKAIFQFAGVGIRLLDVNGRWLKSNPAWEHMLGYSAEELSRLSNLEFTHPDDLASTQARMADLLAGRTHSVHVEKRYLHKDGRTIWVDLSITPIRDEQGQTTAFIGAIVDITERQQAEAALLASEARFATVFRANLLSISIVWVKNGQFIDVNEMWLTKTGFSREEVIGRTALELNLWVNFDEREQFLAQLSEQGTVQGLEAQFRLKSGMVVDVVISAELVDIAGERCMLVITQNITERKQMEEALRASEQKYRQVVEQSNDAIILTDETGRLVEWNSAAEQISGLKQSEVLGWLLWDNLYRIAPPEQQTPERYKQLKAEWLSYFQTGQHPSLNQVIELEMQQPNGTHRIMQSARFSIKTERGYLLSAIIRDVTEQKQAERIEAAQLAVSQVLADSPEPETALRQILESIAADLEWDLAKLWWPKDDGSRLIWRQGWRTPDQPELAEFDRLSRGLAFAPGEGLPGAVWGTGRAIWDQELRLTKPAAEARALRLHSATGIPIIRGEAVVGVMTFFSRSARPLDERLLATLTDLGRQIGQFLARKEAEKTLRRYEQMVATTPDWMALVDRNYVYQIVNQVYLTLHNKSYEQIVGHTVAELLSEAVFTTVVKPNMDRALAGELIQYQAWFDFPVAGRRFTDITYAPYREKNRAISGVTVSGRDITDTKLLEEHLQQVQKMGAIGQLAAGMAHHYNSMLTGIIGFTSLSLHTLPSGDPLIKNLNQVLQTAERMAVLVRQLLAFAQKQLLQLKTTHLNDLVIQLQGQLKQLTPALVEFAFDLAPNVGQVKVDFRQFEYLLQALVSNAVDAMPQGGRLTLTTARVSLGSMEAGWYELPPGDYVRLTVKDTGIGLSDEVKTHLFEPFFSTKGVGQGTGLGLAMALGIARQHGGHLLAESEPGHGATFMLYLPCLAPPQPSLPLARSASTQTILLIEAELIVRDFLAEYLTDQGYTVLKAATNEAALQLIAGRSESSLQLLLTQAYSNSPALIEQLKASTPDLKVIFLVDELEELSFKMRGTQVDFLLKPFTPSDLMEKIQAVLETVLE